MDPPQLEEIIRRIVEVAHPQRIILFGSAARGTMGPDSDIDLLVIKEGPVHRGHLAQDIYQHMLGVGQPVDIIVATPADLERYGKSPALVYRWPLEEGREVYATAGAP
ncbi:MAG: nucleotidyltransferase domain-containing protein [Planctomycetes bacterium]|nr:nucleotidyltransferase domain-containing protein [Planctomycetota bacterium]